MRDEEEVIGCISHQDFVRQKRPKGLLLRGNGFDHHQPPLFAYTTWPMKSKSLLFPRHSPSNLCGCIAYARVCARTHRHGGQEHVQARGVRARVPARDLSEHECRCWEKYAVSQLLHDMNTAVQCTLSMLLETATWRFRTSASSRERDNTKDEKSASIVRVDWDWRDREPSRRYRRAFQNRPDRKTSHQFQILPQQAMYTATCTARFDTENRQADRGIPVTTSVTGYPRCKIQ